MTNQAVIRPATTEDYTDIAALMTESRPDYPRSAENLHYAAEHRPEKCKHQVFVALQGDKIVAYTYYTQHADQYQPGQFHIDIYVQDDFRRKSLGTKLYRAMYEDVLQFQPETLHLRLNETNIDGFIFATKRGYMESSRRIESQLEAAQIDLSTLPEKLENLASQGIDIRSFTDLANDPERDEKVYTIHTTVDADVPLQTPVTPLPYEQWRASVIDHPQFLADGTFLAVHDGQYVGISSLFQFVDDMAYVELTGTLPEYRRKGISTALKLCGIQYAKEAGIPKVGVTNDAVNTGILAINDKLGFIRQPEIIHMKLSV